MIKNNDGSRAGAAPNLDTRKNNNARPRTRLDLFSAHPFPIGQGPVVTNSLQQGSGWYEALLLAGPSTPLARIIATPIAAPTILPYPDGTFFALSLILLFFFQPRGPSAYHLHYPPRLYKALHPLAHPRPLAD